MLLQLSHFPSLLIPHLPCNPPPTSMEPTFFKSHSFLCKKHKTITTSSVIPADHWPGLRHKVKGEAHHIFFPRPSQQLGGTREKLLPLPSPGWSPHLLDEQSEQIFFLSL